MLLNAYVAVVARLSQLRARAADDRGDSPVSTAVIVAGLAAAAVGIVVAITKVADSWAAKIPK